MGKVYDPEDITLESSTRCVGGRVERWMRSCIHALVHGSVLVYFSRLDILSLSSKFSITDNGYN